MMDRHKGEIMPQLVRLYIVNVAFGFAVSAAFVFAIVSLNVAGLGHLVLESDKGLLAGLMLWIFNGVVFAGVQFAVAVMSMADEGGPRGGLREPKLIPIRVEVQAKAKHRR